MLSNAEGDDEEENEEIDKEGPGVKMELAETGKMKKLSDTEDENADGGSMIKDENSVGKERKEEGNLEQIIFWPFFEGID